MDHETEMQIKNIRSVKEVLKDHVEIDEDNDLSPQK